MDLQRQVKGGIPGTENKGIADASNEDDFGWRLDEEKPGQMYTLVLQEVAPDGEIVWKMNLSQALDPEIDEIMPFCGRELWPGLNSIEEMPDGNIISTSYNLSTVFIWDKVTKTVKWRFGNKNNNPTKHRISFRMTPLYWKTATSSFLKTAVISPLIQMARKLFPAGIQSCGGSRPQEQGHRLGVSG